MEPPLCQCGVPAHLREVRKQGPNQGRHFWGCANWPDGCKLFSWAPPGAEAALAAGSRQQGHQQRSPPPQQRGGSVGWQSPVGQQQQPWQSPASQQPSQQWQQPPSQSQQQQRGQSPHSRQQQQQTPASPHQPHQQQQRRPVPRIASPLSLAASGRQYVPLWSSSWEGGPHPDPSSHPSSQQHSQPQQHQQQQHYPSHHYHQSQDWAGPSSQQGGSQPATPAQQRQAGGSPGWQGPPSPGGSQPNPLQQPYQQQQYQQHPLYAPPPDHTSSQQQQQGRGDAGGGGSQPTSQPASQPHSQQRQHHQQGLLESGPGQGPPIKVNLQVVDADTFGAQFRYNEPLKDFLKFLPQPYSGRWDAQRKLWTFPMAHYDEVLAQLRQASPVPVAISPIPPQALARFEEVQCVVPLPKEEVEARLARLPKDLWNRLYGFQREGVRQGVTLGGRVLLCDEMGLGKTVQALCIAACFGPQDWPLLIVCPSTMKLVWADAVRHWLPPELTPTTPNLAVIKDGQSINQLLGRMNQHTHVRVCIVSYDMVKKLGERAQQYRTVIADESHHLKNQEAQRTRAVSSLVKDAARAVLVTGTPALSRPVELYPQINMLRPGLCGSLTEFGMRYCDGKPAQYPMQATMGGYDFRGSSNLAELHQLLERHLMIRRLKKDVLDDLPDKIRKRVPVEADPAHRRGLQQVVLEMKEVEEDEQSGAISGEEASQRRQQLMTELYRRTGPAKVRDVKAHVGSLLEAGEKVLVFVHHQAVLDELQAELKQAGVKHVRIDGQVLNERRKEAVDRFQRDPACRAALLSITAAGVGITLTEATVVVFAELYWNPGHLVQAEDRAHRLGQRKVLEVHYLTAGGTADDTIWELCKRKLGVVGGALGEEGAEEAFEAVRASRKYRTAGERLAQLAEQQQQGEQQQRQQQGDEEYSEDEEERALQQQQQQQHVQHVLQQEHLQRERALEQEVHGQGIRSGRGGSGAVGGSKEVAVEVIEISDSDEEGQGRGQPAAGRGGDSSATVPLSSDGGGDVVDKEAEVVVLDQETLIMAGREGQPGARSLKRQAQEVHEEGDDWEEQWQQQQPRRRRMASAPAGPEHDP